MRSARCAAGPAPRGFCPRFRAPPRVRGAAGLLGVLGRTAGTLRLRSRHHADLASDSERSQECVGVADVGCATRARQRRLGPVLRQNHGQLRARDPPRGAAAGACTTRIRPRFRAQPRVRGCGGCGLRYAGSARTAYSFEREIRPLRGRPAPRGFGPDSERSQECVGVVDVGCATRAWQRRLGPVLRQNHAQLRARDPPRGAAAGACTTRIRLRLRAQPRVRGCGGCGLRYAGVAAPARSRASPKPRAASSARSAARRGGRSLHHSDSAQIPSAAKSAWVWRMWAALRGLAAPARSRASPKPRAASSARSAARRGARILFRFRAQPRVRGCGGLGCATRAWQRRLGPAFAKTTGSFEREIRRAARRQEPAPLGFGPDSERSQECVGVADSAALCGERPSFPTCRCWRARAPRGRQHPPALRARPGIGLRFRSGDSLPRRAVFGRRSKRH